MPDSKDYIPAEIRLPHGVPSAWGRLARVDPAGCGLVSRFELKEGSGAALAFELGDETFSDIMSRVRSRRRDAEGYFTYELFFTNELQRRNLQLTLARMQGMPGDVV
ncbi:MAG: hypothetical protein FD189_682 [Elusimicrobia bacterium]|nr:MAG: hypothetical protein FD154_1305 [Elusimicrobiota bacterium]KAF0157113.1 MAG: hypothetical protein FD189_682 [Elusimicrobiota bacterium]